MNIGFVAGRPVPVSELDVRLARMYASPVAVGLPARGDREWRQLRRWVAQLLLTEALVRTEAERLGVADTGEPAPAEQTRLAASGSLSAAVLAAQPLARALFASVTADIDISDDEARRYYARSIERWRRPATCVLHHLIAPDETAARRAIPRLEEVGELWRRPVAELPKPVADAVRNAAAGAIVGPVRSPFGWHVARVLAVTTEGVAPYPEVRQEIMTRLRDAKRAEFFDRWLEQRRRELVVVERGFEHPGDPNQPDFTHHH